MPLRRRKRPNGRTSRVNSVVSNEKCEASVYDNLNGLEQVMRLNLKAGENAKLGRSSEGSLLS